MQRSAPYRPPLPQANAANGASVNGRCPLLGTPADPGTAISFPSDANQCYSARFAVPVSTIHQENYCLSDHYESCPVYRQRQQTAAAAVAAPLAAAVAAPPAAAVGAPLVAEIPTAPEWGEPEPISAAAVATMSAAGAAAYAGPPPPPLFNWEQPTHPDFQADMDAAAARRRPARGVDSRAVLVALLLLALIPLAWWIFTSLRSDMPQAITPGTVVTLPTSRAADNQAAVATTGAGGIAVLPEMTPMPSATSSGAAEPAEPATITPIPTMSQLESVAATATALFLNATLVTECAAPEWWVAYTVEAGDTIEALAAQRGIRPEELIVANCLAGPELTPGGLLRLPPVGVIVALPATVAPTVTTTPAPSRTAGPTRFPALPTPPVVIIFPTPTFPFFGTATAEPPEQPTDSPTRPPARPTTRPTQAPTSAVPPTATAPNPFATATSPGNRPTATPPGGGQPTATPPFIQPSRTPPVGGNNPTPTGTPTQTPPAVTP